MSDLLEEALRERWAEIAAALLPVHKLLIEAARGDWERHHGQVAGPQALFHLLTTDPFFAWLQPLTSLMADIDARLDDEAPFGRTHSAELHARVEELIGGEVESPSPFSTRYLALLQSSPDLLFEHAQLRRVLKHV